MQGLHNGEPGDVQPAFNIQEIRRCASNFRKLMLLFPYVHPAALHGVIVKNNSNWEQILHVLFAGQDARAEQFWGEVNEHRELEQALQRRGVRLICCNGFSEILLSSPHHHDTYPTCNMQQSPIIPADQCPGVHHPQTEEIQNPSVCHHRQELNCINIIIEQQNPQQPNGDNVSKTVCEVETQTNDVIRIILGQRNGGLLVNNTKNTFEVVRTNSAENNQSTYIIRNVTDGTNAAGGSAPAEVQQSVKKTRRTQRRAVPPKPEEKKTRARKPKRAQSKELTNEQNGTLSVDVENKPAAAAAAAPCQIPTSKKGKASSNTRVKSSKHTTNNNNNN